MSRTFKDKPYRLGGQRHPYYCTDDRHAAFTRQCRRRARRRANMQLHTGIEPPPKYPCQYEYWD